MRRLFACSFVALTGLTIAAGTGCRMCASPYDYCGPVVECDNGNYGGGYHAGTSAPADGQYYENGSGPEEIQRPGQNMGQPTPAPAPTPATGPMASRTQNQNPFMRSSRY
jgi:hypothetical protein